MAAKKTKLLVDAWPQLIEALSRETMLGNTPEEVARYLIVAGLDDRHRARAALRRERAAAVASGYRGDI